MGQVVNHASQHAADGERESSDTYSNLTVLLLFYTMAAKLPTTISPPPSLLSQLGNPIMAGIIVRDSPPVKKKKRAECSHNFRTTLNSNNTRRYHRLSSLDPSEVG